MTAPLAAENSSPTTFGDLDGIIDDSPLIAGRELAYECEDIEDLCLL